MIYDFDTPVDRRLSDSSKWSTCPPGVLPLPVADMDFLCPEPVVRALHERVDHGVFGYGCEPAGLREAIVDRLYRLYRWQVPTEALVFLPGVVAGFNLACRALAAEGRGVLVQPPVYPPILSAPGRHGLRRLEAPLVRGEGGRYQVDWDAFEEAASEAGLFLLCSPHNPVSRVFTRAELERLAETCLRHRVIICSDEIHCDLVYRGYEHIPIASLAPEVGRRTVTLMAPSKTYNIPGLHCAFAVIEDEALRRRYQLARAGLVGEPNVLGFVAALAAYREGQEWLEQVLAYLEANRDFLAAHVAANLPGVRITPVEGTFLAWLDCRELALPGGPSRFFLEEARVDLSDGATFGAQGEGFVRLNFACSRGVLQEALDRMAKALEGVRPVA
ncbi:MAG: putative C-S lyase [Anaerolineae bacterium]|nr:putative C-S lyase [Anaerolineae bacterium]